MTFREKLKEDYPQCTGDRFKNGVIGCPYDYDYESSYCNHYPIPRDDCADCWDREMPEPDISNICDGRKNMEDENELDNVSIWPEVVLLLAFLGLFFIIAVSQML